jgi:drug/metabolite transporter (DMT)-like permease
MVGNLLALAGALAVAGYLMLGRRLRAQMSLLPYIFIVYGFAACALLVMVVVSGQPAIGLPVATYGWIFLLAALPQVLGHSTYNWALRYLPATLVAVTTLGEPLGSSVLAFAILGEAPSPAQIAGGALLLLGVYLAARHSAPATARVAPPHISENGTEGAG